MIDPATLAQFVGNYPDESCLLSHDLDGLSIFSVPSLTVIATALPRSACVTYDHAEEAAESPYGKPTDVHPAAALQALPARPFVCELSKLRRNPDVASVLNDLERLLTPVIGTSSRNVQFTEARLFAAGANLGMPSVAQQDHVIHFLLRGEATMALNGQDDMQLSAGEAMFIPAQSELRLTTGAIPSFWLTVSWTTQRLSNATDSQQFRQSVGMTRTGAIGPRRQQIEAMVFRALKRFGRRSRSRD